MTRDSLFGVLRAAGAATALAALTGCTGAPEGNGKHGQLFFLGRQGELAAGVPFSVVVADVRKVPEGDIQDDDYRYDRWDFAATRLEVQAPPGLDFVVQYSAPSGNPEAASGYTLRANCDAAPGILHEVQLKVVSYSGSVRYQDAINILCTEPTGMRVSARLPNGAIEEPPSGRYLAGGAVELAVTLTAGGGRPLAADGLRLEDLRGILRQREPQRFLGTGRFDLISVGTRPELSFRGVVHPLPLEVVSDPGWTLELGPWGAEYGASFSLRPTARGSDGSPLLGLDVCSWDLWFGGTNVETRSGCALGESRRPTRACVTAHGRRACREDP